MKKFIALFLAAVMCFGLTACGKKTLEEATADANSKIDEWNEKDYNGFEYIPMESNEGHFNIILLAQLDNDIMLTESVVKVTVKDVYKELKKSFKGHDIDVGIIVAKSADEILYTYSEEELVNMD